MKPSIEIPHAYRKPHGTIGLSEEARLHLLRRRRRTSRGSDCPAAGDGAAGAAIRDPNGPPAGGAGRDRRLPKSHWSPFTRRLQYASKTRLDARLAPAHGGDASRDPFVSRETSAGVGKVLAPTGRAGHGGFVGSELQSGAARCAR